MDKSKKGRSKLIIACSDPAENFEFIEETLNQVAFLISNDEIILFCRFTADRLVGGKKCIDFVF